MKTLAIITEGVLPVPAIKGGAIGELIECLVRENEKKHNIKMIIYSIYDPCFKDIEKLKYSIYKYIQTPKVCRILDNIIYNIAYNVFHCEKSEKFKNILSRLNYLHNIKRELKINKFDYVCLEGNTTLLKTISKTKDISLRSKIYFHLHNEVGTVYGCEDVVNQLDGIIGNSQYVIDEFTKKHKCGQEVKKTVVKNCVSSQMKSHGLDIHEKFNIPTNKKIIVYVGRLTRQKGVKELITAFSKLEDKEVALVIVGSAMFGLKTNNSYESELHDLANICDKQIVFTGFIPNKKIGTIYTQANVAVFPALFGEAAGLTIIEALSFGAKVITTNVGGIPEYINESIACILDVNASLIDQMTSSIENLMKSEIQNKQFVIDYINNEFNEEKYYKRMMSVFLAN